MAKDLGDAIGTALGRVARETVQTVSSNGRKRSGSPLSGPVGLAAGAGLVALAPLATKGAGKLVRGIASNGAAPVKKAGDKLGGTVKEAVGETVEKAGGAPGLAKEAGKSLLPGGGDGGGGGGKSKGKPGVGKGRRMPIQQDIDIGAPLKTVYNQWTQFEEWPEFMHRLENVSQEDETNLSFKTKIWGISKEFKAEIVEQRPDERIKWEVVEGVTHTGVVTFHELGPRLTRVEVNIDVQPGSLIEKAARGMRHVKRAVRADLARFKAYVLMQDEESGAWRGEIEDGDVKQQRSSGGGSSGSRSKASSSGRSRSASSSKQSRGASSSKQSRASSSGRAKSSGSSGRSASSSNGRSGSKRSRASSSNGSGGGSGSGSSRSSGRRKSASGSRS
ncbi:MAG TPA: SRPBCC family protein [Thermoleophilaceae bacterium]|jgi:uncharacterized membrane protein